MRIFAKHLLTPSGWRENQTVEIEGGIIRQIGAGTDGGIQCEYLTAGMFDVHAHGGEGFYTLTPDWALLNQYLMKLALSGVTDILLGISTYAGAEGYKKAMDFAREAMAMQAEGRLDGAHIQGVHLEGPFLNPVRSGAMNPDMMPPPSIETYEMFFGGYDDIVKLVTLAPEREGARELTAHLLKKGIKVQSGHTDASYEEAQAAFGWGVDSQCHTFNAARGIHHREPGVVTAALLNKNVYCEVICDFKHLHPAAVELIYRMKGPERMEIISDSVAVTGLPDGEHVINGRKYLIVDGTQRVKGGNTLSGGACYLDGAVRNLISIGIPTEDVFRMASQTPAERIGNGSIGRIRPGCEARLAAWNGAWECGFTVVGNQIYENNRQKLSGKR